MDLFIRMKDGEPFGHPLSADNLRQVFPDFDAANPLPDFALFIPSLPDQSDGVYRTCDLRYRRAGDVVKGVWEFRDMTEEEGAKEIALVKSCKPDGDQWVFNETLCEWQDPAALEVNTKIGVSRV